MNLHPSSLLTVVSFLKGLGKWAFAAIFLACPLHALDQRHTYTTDRELQGFIDSNDDGLLDVLIIDRSTGRYRIGYQTGATLSWEGPYPTGISDPSGFSVAPITNSGRDELVVAGPGANRVHLLDTWTGGLLNNPGTILPSGVGPSSVAALDINQPGNDPARADLVVFSQYNNPPSTCRRHVFLTSGNITETATQIYSLASDQAARVFSHLSQPPRLAYFIRNPSPDSDSLTVRDASSAGLTQLTSLTGLPSGSRFVHAAFDTGNPNAIQFVLFTPGGTELIVAPIDPLTESFPANPSLHSLGMRPVEGVFLAQRSNVTGVVVIFDEGREAGFYTFSASMHPQLQEVLLPPSGKRFTGALGFANNRLSMLTGTSFNSASENVVHYDGSGGSWIETGSQSIARAGNQTALTNVFLYDKEPLLNPDARLLRAFHAPDWTSGLTIDAAANVIATIEDYAGPLTGLAFSAFGTLLKEPKATFGYANQIRDDISLSSTSSLLGALHLDLSIDPASGSYADFIEPRLVVADPASVGPGFQAWYRFAHDQNWQAFDVNDPTSVIPPPFGGLLPFTVWYYAEDTTTGARSAIQSASYTPFGVPDTDKDKVPDFVEVYNGLDPRGGEDSDQDGFSDLEEIVSNTDANDPLSKPLGRFSGTLNAFDLAVRPLMHNGDLANPVFRPTWPDSHPDYDGAVLRAWNLDGKLYGTAITENEGIAGISDPVALFPQLPVEDKDAFLVITSTRTFPFHQIQGLQGTAPELIGIVPVPNTTEAPPEFIPDPGQDLATNVTDWLQTMRSYYGDLQRPLVTAEIGPLESLKFLLTERILGILAEGDPLSLTGFRDPQPPKPTPAPGTNTRLSQADLLALQSYQPATGGAWSLQSIYSQVSDIIDANADFRIQQLVQLATDIYGIWVSDTNGASPNPGLYPAPFDVLRDIVQDMPVSGVGDNVLPLPGRTAAPQISYAGDLALSSSEQGFVEICLRLIIAGLQARPTKAFLAEVTPSTFDGVPPVLESQATGNELHLLTASGRPYLFSPGTALPVGAVVHILAFTDRYNLPEIEVISADLISVPLPPPVDLDQNLIDDSLQAFFFSTGSPDPFEDPDNDGFMTFQELIAQSDPLFFASQPTDAPVEAFPPAVTLTVPSPGQVKLAFDFPADYADQLGFALESSSNLKDFHPAGASADATPKDSDTWASETSGPAAPGDPVFYRFRAFLK